MNKPYKRDSQSFPMLYDIVCHLASEMIQLVNSLDIQHVTSLCRRPLATMYKTRHEINTPIPGWVAREKNAAHSIGFQFVISFSFFVISRFVVYRHDRGRILKTHRLLAAKKDIQPPRGGTDRVRSSFRLINTTSLNPNDVPMPWKFIKKGMEKEQKKLY